MMEPPQMVMFSRLGEDGPHKREWFCKVRKILIAPVVVRFKILIIFDEILVILSRQVA